jgi:uncharacterized protein affecting Mg2+/Co2+ transport
MKIQARSILIVLRFICLAVAASTPKAFGVVPAPDGCYPNYTTAEGCNALKFLTTGAGNTGVGWYSLFSNTDANFNTGIGGGALALNNADANTAVGAAALLLNTAGHDNTANGTDALLYNDSGNFNTAVGSSALLANTGGQNNTAVGFAALGNNPPGNDNTAIGSTALLNTNGGMANTAVGRGALFANINGSENTAIGSGALGNQPPGNYNTAVGSNALLSTSGMANTGVGHAALFDNSTGTFNTAIGDFALSFDTTGSVNIGVGAGAGSNVTTANGVICIGSDGGNVSTTTWIGNIYGVTTVSGTTLPVRVSDDGQLGTAASARRFKQDIKPMDEESEAILALKPVTFHYKSDKTSTPQFGLIAEEVAAVNPKLVVHNKNGELYSVRYEEINAMLLNEFLKEHCRVKEQQAAIAELRSVIAQQQKGVETLTARLEQQAAQIQSVSAQLELRKAAPQTLADVH